MFSFYRLLSCSISFNVEFFSRDVYTYLAKLTNSESKIPSIASVYLS